MNLIRIYWLLKNRSGILFLSLTLVTINTLLLLFIKDIEFTGIINIMFITLLIYDLASIKIDSFLDYYNIAIIGKSKTIKTAIIVLLEIVSPKILVPLFLTSVYTFLNFNGSVSVICKKIAVVFFIYIILSTLFTFFKTLVRRSSLFSVSITFLVSILIGISFLSFFPIRENQRFKSVVLLFRGGLNKFDVTRNEISLLYLLIIFAFALILFYALNVFLVTRNPIQNRDVINKYNKSRWF